jgi:hypothetical protein
MFLICQMNLIECVHEDLLLLKTKWIMAVFIAKLATSSI